MDLKLQDKTAIVTGSTAGIGKAIASILAQEGAAVIVNGRTQARVTEAIAQIQQIAPSAKLTGIAADLATAAGAEALFQQVPAVDILVNNLGIYAAKPFKEWQRRRTSILSRWKLTSFRPFGLLPCSNGLQLLKK